ncbi:DNA primase small subunit [Bienertia sinuspersici]
MPQEEIENGRDDMLIDGPENPNPNATSEGFNANYLKVYYSKLFPYSDMFKWMSYGNDGKHPGCDLSYFSRREFSFTLDNDIYLRFQSFKSASELENAVKEKCPFKIDIGPVYSVDPSKRHAYSQTGDNVFTPVERELDMTDYDDIRYCCSGADVCQDCWPLMTVAIKIIDTTLRVVGVVYTVGFVIQKARRLTNEQRAAVADIFMCTRATRIVRKRRSYTEVLRKFFEETYLSSQKLLSTEERYEKVLEMITDESVASEFRGKWEDNRRSSNSREDINVVRWGQLKNGQGLRRCVEDIVFSYTYPRLDSEVSKHMNHLLKAPFCVHPKTGRVCVPIDPKQCEDFDPTSVPTLTQLMEET